MLVVSCAAVPDAAPGINQAENAALISTYYWKPEFGIPAHDRESLAVLESRSEEVRDSVEHFLSFAWSYNKLKYPRTQAIYNQNEEAESQR